MGNDFSVLLDRIEYLSDIIRKTSAETQSSLSLIKTGYVDDVLGKMRDLIQEIKNTMKEATEKTQDQFESGITSFVMITEKLEIFERNLTILVDSQSDQLAALAALRNSVSNVIQVELSSLREQVVASLETTTNAQRTLLNEQRIGFQNLTNSSNQIIHSINEFPNLVEAKLDSITQNQITEQLSALRDDLRRMRAMIISEIRQRPERCPHCGNPVS